MLPEGELAEGEQLGSNSLHFRYVSNPHQTGWIELLKQSATVAAIEADRSHVWEGHCPDFAVPRVTRPMRIGRGGFGSVPQRASPAFR